MIASYKLTLKYDGAFSVSPGYSFYGLLCSLLPSEDVEILHGDGAGLLAQNVVFNNSTHSAVWSVNVFDEEIADAVEKALLAADVYGLDNPKMTLTRTEYQKKLYTSLQSMLAQAEAELGGTKDYDIHFSTPTSHKKAGAHVFFPEATLFLNSIIDKCRIQQPDFSVDDNEATSLMLSAISLRSYKLQSSYYHLKEGVVPGFTGRITVRIAASEPIVQLWRLLLWYSGFCGTGIKTTLGMGKTSVKRER